MTTLFDFDWDKSLERRARARPVLLHLSPLALSPPALPVPVPSFVKGKHGRERAMREGVGLANSNRVFPPKWRHYLGEFGKGERASDRQGAQGVFKGNGVLNFKVDRSKGMR